MINQSNISANKHSFRTVFTEIYSKSQSCHKRQRINPGRRQQYTGSKLIQNYKKLKITKKIGAEIERKVESERRRGTRKRAKERNKSKQSDISDR